MNLLKTFGKALKNFNDPEKQKARLKNEIEIETLKHERDEIKSRRMEQANKRFKIGGL